MRPGARLCAGKEPLPPSIDTREGCPPRSLGMRRRARGDPGPAHRPDRYPLDAVGPDAVAHVVRARAYAALVGPAQVVHPVAAVVAPVAGGPALHVAQVPGPAPA